LQSTIRILSRVSTAMRYWYNN